MRQLKHIILLFQLVALTNWVSGQEKMTYRLQQAISKSGNERITLLVQFTNNGISSLLPALNGKSKNERAKLVASFLSQQADNQKALLYKEAEKLGFTIYAYTPLWIANGAKLTLESKSVFKLKSLNSIAQMALPQDYAIEFSKPVSTAPAAKAINGSEIGLHAIGAPFMWQMGYTGKAKKLLSVDTGVNTDHPAIQEQWLGNYWPIQHAWYAYDSPFPSDKSDSHGTHTTGTVLGLEKATNDTIGAAFNAYFFASDPIVQAVVDIKSYDELIRVFQWCLNPDGDTATTDDIPDAINNSWGRSPDGSFDICGVNFFTETFLAIEAAGVANVFSAGNNGPNAQTIGNPANINVGMFNAFSVGAVNGSTPSYPITSFSSRGPSICGGGGSLEIKPEVVAPGQNVRSCVGHSDYGSYSGTSMAAPHVCGAVLLLSEAFPTATGQEILSALYQTANDLGAIGEDNVYGNGMISLENAFNLLAQTFTVSPPNNVGIDLKLETINTALSAFTCENNADFTANLTNIGTQTANSYTISWGIDSIVLGNTIETTPLTAGASKVISVSLTNELLENLNEFWIAIEVANDIDLINNKRFFRFNKRPTATLPYFEDFETTNLHFSEWYVENSDSNTSWDTTLTSGLPNSNFSAFMRLSDYFPRSNQHDGLYTPIIELPSTGPLWLTFNYAYQMKTTFFNDSLKIWASTNCGQSWDYLLKAFGPEELNTFDTLQNYFVPTRPDMWASDTVDLSTLVGLGTSMLKFETINRAGNNLFLDNISIFDQRGPANIQPTYREEKSFASIFPNPAKDQITLSGVALDEPTQIKLVNILGEILLEKIIDPDANTALIFSLQDYTPGVYFIQIQQDNFQQTLRFVKE